jgi:hypothetical protein
VIGFAGAVLVGCWDFACSIIFFVVHIFMYAFKAALCYCISNNQSAASYSRRLDGVGEDDEILER